jgi:outer membrane protein
MIAKLRRAGLIIALSSCALSPQTLPAAQASKEPPGRTEGSSTAPRRLPGVFRAYQEQVIPRMTLSNSPRLESLIHDGKLELSLADALALALENNLDIAVQRYIPKFAQTDVLRTQSGQAARGFTGALIPGGLTSGALGAGVSGAGAGSGVGNAGGITGGGGAVQVGPTGVFDPSLSFNFSWDRASSPLNTIQVSGVPVSTGQTTAFSGSYAQLLPQGTSYSLTLSTQRQSSTQQFLRFNPAAVSRFALGFNQPLTNGFGRLPNERFIRVARNNTKVADEVFQQQVITTVVTVANAYWDLAAARENVRVAEQSLGVSERLLKDNQFRVEVGTMSPLEVVSAEAEVAGRTRDLTVARTNLQLQEAALKNFLSKKVSPELDTAGIVIKDPMPEPRDSDLPNLSVALGFALENRPDLRQTERNLQNQDVSLRFTENSLPPGVSVFGFYAGSGLYGDSPTAQGGLWDALGQTLRADYPEYAGGATVSIPLRNRVAQADNIRSQLEGQQLKVSLQRSRNQVSLEVRKAVIGIIQGKAQVQAAHEATRLAREIWQGEQNKLEAGASTSYQIILRERDFVAAQQAELNAVVGYAKAMVEVDRAMGATLRHNGIEFADALSGTVTKMPVPPSGTPTTSREVK